MKPALDANGLHNHLLAALPLPVRQRLLPHLDLCTLAMGRSLHEAGKSITQVYFPLDALVSLIYVTAEGSSSEIAMVGNEGVVSIAPFLGSDSSLTAAVVHSTGRAYRLPTRALLEELDHHAELMLHILRYTQTLITQISLTAACSRHHTLEQQLCRWLLLVLDRVPEQDLRMTQELIANSLGVRREGITLAAGKLQKGGVISYSRGHIWVRDRKQLELLSCDCYRIAKAETEKLFAGETDTR